MRRQSTRASSSLGNVASSLRRLPRPRGVPLVEPEWTYAALVDFDMQSQLDVGKL